MKYWIFKTNNRIIAYDNKPAVIVYSGRDTLKVCNLLNTNMDTLEIEGDIIYIDNKPVAKLLKPVRKPIDYKTNPVEINKLSEIIIEEIPIEDEPKTIPTGTPIPEEVAQSVSSEIAQSDANDDIIPEYVSEPIVESNASEVVEEVKIEEEIKEEPTVEQVEEKPQTKKKCKRKK